MFSLNYCVLIPDKNLKYCIFFCVSLNMHKSNVLNQKQSIYNSTFKSKPPNILLVQMAHFRALEALSSAPLSNTERCAMKAPRLLRRLPALAACPTHLAFSSTGKLANNEKCLTKFFPFFLFFFFFFVLFCFQHLHQRAQNHL